jgi:protein involved in sex pheromone biosynthesis
MKKHIALGLVASTLFLAGCCTSHHSTAWEYKTAEVIPDAAHDANINKLAVDGWTIQSISYQQSGGYFVVLKRPTH